MFKWEKYSRNFSAKPAPQNANSYTGKKVIQVALKICLVFSQPKNPCGVLHAHSNGHTWADCFSNPTNTQKRANYHAKRRNKGSRSKDKANSADVTILEARLAASEALNKIYTSKNKAPSAATAIAHIDVIVSSTSDNEAEKEDALIELSYALSSMSTVNGADSSTCYLVETSFTADENDTPILDSGASTTFVTSDDYLPKPRKQKTSIETANGKISFTNSSSKYKMTKTSRPIYTPALFSPDFR